MTTDSKIRRAEKTAKAYRVCDGLFLLGSLEKGLTVYNQQVRAHNLVWALWELHRAKMYDLGRVAVIGGGAAGLTATAGLLSRMSGQIQVTLFERLWDLCALQQGADTRWLHPRIYEWPAKGSRAPGASLPLLNWSEGRASDVVRRIADGFGKCCEQFARQPSSLTAFIGLKKLRVRADTRNIEWYGTRAERAGSFFRTVAPEEELSAKFDTIIIASGFGLERIVAPYPHLSYWRNEQFAQPLLDGSKKTFIISGYGDGALVDLCRLTIERFRQDTILYELFGSSLEVFENELGAALQAFKKTPSLFPILGSIDARLLTAPRDRLKSRLRKDTRVILNIRGRKGTNKSIEDVFGPSSSQLNRLLAYLLNSCGAFETSLSDLAQCVRESGDDDSIVVCRHGTDVFELLGGMIVDFANVDHRLQEMYDLQEQEPEPLWEPGAFPIAS